MNEFSNPIVEAQAPFGSADPSVVFHDGFYYYCKSLADAAIGVAKATRLQDIGKAEMKLIWKPPPGTDYSEQVWAPELQWVRGCWHIYFAASDGNNENHRMYVLQGETTDPQGAFVFKGRIAATSDQWAIDGNSFEHEDVLYFVWSGWRAKGDGFPQVTYIAKMSDPCTIEGERREIACPDREWEQRGASVMEGHVVLQHDGSVHLIYSASGSWTENYTLGMLTFIGGDILEPSSWRKHDSPVFAALPEAGVFGPGHNSFVKSPDSGEDWIVYHAIETASGGWAQRSVRAQKFAWRADGTPDFGLPLGRGVKVAEPSGSSAAPVLGEFSASVPRMSDDGHAELPALWAA